MRDPNFPAFAKIFMVGFIASDAALMKILIDKQAPLVLPAVTNENAAPGETAVRQRVLLGGGRVVDGNIYSTDTVAKILHLSVGTEFNGIVNSVGGLTLGAPTITATNIINRTTGSFLTAADNNGYAWRPGDIVVPFGATTAANNGQVGIITAVAALTLTVNGTPWTNETPSAGTFRLIRAAQRHAKTIAITAGSIGTVPPVPLMGGTQDPANAAVPDTGLELGVYDMLLANLAAATSALPAHIQVAATMMLR